MVDCGEFNLLCITMVHQCWKHNANNVRTFTLQQWKVNKDAFHYQTEEFLQHSSADMQSASLKFVLKL